DFLAHGEAVNALMDIVGQAGATLAGVAIAIEKGFQGGGDALRKKGVNLYSLAVIDSMENGEVVFRN
ncbi:MAG: xanthine phosphoribosyltransferase, partial [Clostridia bacterium]|nr:xanthine phosphoribosyltransferase [Clostridia bacterium]